MSYGGSGLLARQVALAAPAGQLPDLGLLALFGGGAVLLRGAGLARNPCSARYHPPAFLGCMRS